MIDTWQQALPHGITLSCRSCGPKGRPVLLFLHGFPEAAFVWDGVLEHFARPENGGYRCVAPNLRGYEQSSAPEDIKAYRAKYLVQDVVALIDAECGEDQALAALVAHDWGGAIAWNVANQHPQRLQQLVIVNAPHPGLFLDALKHDPAQQAASAYMLFLVQADAAALLSENNFARLLGFLSNSGDHALGGPSLSSQTAQWLTPALAERYRSVWRQSLQGGLNYYSASPLRPATPQDDSILAIDLPPASLHIGMPTLVLWAQNDIALLPCLTEGLEQHIPDLKLVSIANATHWVLHEQPARVMAEIGAFLKTPAPALQ